VSGWDGEGQGMDEWVGWRWVMGEWVDGEGEGTSEWVGWGERGMDKWVEWGGTGDEVGVGREMG